MLFYVGNQWVEFEPNTWGFLQCCCCCQFCKFLTQYHKPWPIWITYMYVWSKCLLRYVKVQEKPIKLYIGKHRLKKKINNRLKTTVLTLCTIKWGKLNAQGEILPSKHSCPRGPSYQLWWVKKFARTLDEYCFFSFIRKRCFFSSN